MDRRKFILNTGLAVGAAKLIGCSTQEAASNSLNDWAVVRAQFPLNPNKIHMAQMFLASHPKVVTDEINIHREKFDADPIEYWETNHAIGETKVRESAAKYLGVSQEELALTDSTTMGLAMIFNGLRLKPGDEILTTTHDHYSTERSMEFASARNGATIRKVSLYTDASKANVDEITTIVRSAIQPATRVLHVTWVHSCTGVKLPLKEIAAVVAEVNNNRNEDKRIYLSVDGVHGLGVDDSNIPDLGVDFFVGGTHKWIFGPRGTGILYARKDAASFLAPTIPPFSDFGYGNWLGLTPAGAVSSFTDLHSPGGFHSFEYRWALNKAFDFHMEIGKTRVWERTRDLSTQLKKQLSDIKGIKLHTPLDPALSAGINCFEIDGVTPEDWLRRMTAAGIVASTTPYKTVYCRVTPSIVNNEEEVNTVVKSIEGMAV
jgi:selenocysteine lyase/cysteine desulfurase